MPVDMREWLPEDDLVFVVLDAVATLDLGAFRRSYAAAQAAGTTSRRNHSDPMTSENTSSAPPAPLASGWTKRLPFGVPRRDR
jgi:hypothetical protein